MKKGFFDRRIPTTLALFLLLGGIAITMLLVNQGVFTVTQATPEQEPKNVTVTNVTENSFSVAFITLEKTVAAVSLNVDGKEMLLFDDRDSDEKKAYYSHIITVNNLQPNSNYGYKILSNGTSYPETDELFQAKTGGKISKKPEDVSMKGSVLLPDGSEASDTLILITPQDGTIASAVTDTNGSYTIPASLLKNASGTNYLNPNNTIQIQIQALQKNLSSIIDASFIPKSILPPISLSENYEFIADIGDVILATPSSLFKQPDAKISNTLQILAPKNKEALVDSRPQIQGTAPAGSLIRITIDGKNSAQLRSSPNGNWSFRSSVPLAAGDHTISVTSGGRSVKQEFSVFSSGSQIAETATPSATLAPSSSPSQSPTPTITLTETPSPEPTLVQSPTPIGIAVTSIPIGAPTEAIISNSPTPTTFVPTKIPLPPTGTTEQSILLTGAALLFIVTGSVLFFIL